MSLARFLLTSRARWPSSARYGRYVPSALTEFKRCRPWQNAEYHRESQLADGTVGHQRRKAVGFENFSASSPLRLSFFSSSVSRVGTGDVRDVHRRRRVVITASSMRCTPLVLEGGAAQHGLNFGSQRTGAGRPSRLLRQSTFFQVPCSSGLRYFGSGFHQVLRHLLVVSPPLGGDSWYSNWHAFARLRPR